ncbi:MAG: hypothetical protein JF616_16640 [Fibrobacteres bacterium]|jgi:hypothetical protein|nr:hypothetical protein [Fibrobacterota bacterium]
MIKRAWKLVLAPAGLAALLFWACDKSATGPGNGTAFGNLSAPDSVYAAYTRLYDPPCTLTVSFNYDPAKQGGVEVAATLDSGISWIPVATIAPGGPNPAKVVWPLDRDADTGHFDFFGYKEAYLKLTEKASGQSIQSGKFNVIGNIPFVLNSPKGGETFAVKDSIPLQYAVNTHLTAQIKPCIRPDDTTIQWKALEKFTSSTTLTFQRGPIRSFVQKFTLAYFDTTLAWTGKWADHPLQVMLKDYGSGGKIKFSGLIAITQD